MSGNHTCGLFLAYHRCPHCGCINESRKDYIDQLGELVKELTCERCKKKFTEKKAKHYSGEYLK